MGLASKNIQKMYPKTKAEIFIISIKFLMKTYHNYEYIWLRNVLLFIGANIRFLSCIDPKLWALTEELLQNYQPKIIKFIPVIWRIGKYTYLHSWWVAYLLNWTNYFKQWNTLHKINFFSRLKVETSTCLSFISRK